MMNGEEEENKFKGLFLKSLEREAYEPGRIRIRLPNLLNREYHLTTR